MLFFRKILQTYSDRKIFFLLVLGFSSGLPFLLILSSLSFWLSELGYREGMIGLFTSISLPYSLKFLWAPLVEQVPIPFLSKALGQKRSYGLISQILLMAAIFVLGASSPEKTPWITAIVGFCICFLSATQDIVIDGLRIELVSSNKMGGAAAMESIGFHLGKLASGVGVLYLAASFHWENAYKLMSFGIIPGILALWFLGPDVLKKSASHKNLNFLKSLKLRYQLPLMRLIQNAPILYLIGFIVCFKFSDIILNATMPCFLHQLGLSKIAFANITKFYGTSLMIGGAIIAGMMMDFMGLFASGVICALLMAVSCILFSIQAMIGYEHSILFMTIGVESFASGMSNSVFIGILSAFCIKPYSGSHFTILYSIGSFSRVVISAFSGFLAELMGWSWLYFISAIFLLPTLFYLKKLNFKE